MKMKKLVYTILITILVVSLSSNLLADDALPYVRMGVGSKALSMGSAFTAIANNITATYWNPAGLGACECLEIGSMYSANMGLDREHNYLGISRTFPFGTLALSWINAGWRDFPGTNGNYDIMNNNISISYGNNIIKNLKIGFSAKAYTQDIVEETENGFGFDAGLLYNMHPQVSVGFMMRDFVSSFADDEEEIPYQANAGLAVKPFDFIKEKLVFLNGFTIAGDIRKIQDESDIIMSLGGEYALNLKDISDIDANTSFRIGSNDGHFAAGFGIILKMFEFNYAFTADTSEEEIFEDSSRFSLIMRLK